MLIEISSNQWAKSCHCQMNLVFFNGGTWKFLSDHSWVKCGLFKSYILYPFWSGRGCCNLHWASQTWKLSFFHLLEAGLHVETQTLLFTRDTPLSATPHSWSLLPGDCGLYFLNAGRILFRGAKLSSRGMRISFGPHNGQGGECCLQSEFWGQAFSSHFGFDGN